MANPLFERFGQMMGGGNNAVPGPLQNMANFVQSYNQFKNSLNAPNGNAGAYAQQQVQQMLNSGKITQEQFNQVAAFAQQLQGFVK